MNATTQLSWKTTSRSFTVAGLQILVDALRFPAAQASNDPARGAGAGQQAAARCQDEAQVRRRRATPAETMCCSRARRWAGCVDIPRLTRDADQIDAVSVAPTIRDIMAQMKPAH